MTFLGYISSRLSRFICIAAVALASTSVFGAPKDDLPDGPVPDDPEPDPGPDRPDPERPVPDEFPPRDGSVFVSRNPDVVLLRGRIFDADTLPLCEWADSERSLLRFMSDPNIPAALEPWTCKLGQRNDSQGCTFSSGPTPHPVQGAYVFAPREWQRAPSAVGASLTTSRNLVWPNGSAMYAPRFIACSQDETPEDGMDDVSESRTQGAVWRDSSCSSATGYRSTVLAEVDGEAVRHKRPVSVLVQANVGYVRAAGPRNIDDLEVVVQVYGSNGWEDFKSWHLATSPFSRNYEVEVANVPAHSLVRAQLRGLIDCNAHQGDGYNIRGVRILVETCLPDTSNPGECF